MRPMGLVFAIGTCALSLLSACGVDPAGEQLETAPLSPREFAIQSFNKAPLAFEENVGQTDPQVQFLVRAKGYNAYFTAKEMVFDVVVQKPSAEGAFAVEPSTGDLPLPDAALDEPSLRAPKTTKAPKATRPSGAGLEMGEYAALKVTLIDANAEPKAVGEKKLPGVANYIIGDDPSKWLTEVPRYEQVRYKSVYKGIDLVVYGNQALMEHDFVLDPKADYKQIRLGFDGASKLTIKDNGDLAATLADDFELVFKKPNIYQEIGDKKVKVEGSYVLNSAMEVGFKVGEYDSTRPLVIDPTTLTYSSFLGGAADDLTWGVAFDGSGNVYVVGYTKSAGFPVVGGLGSPNNALQGTFDAYITKINAAGTANTYTTYLGGTGVDLANSIKVDTNGNAYVTGYTTSTNFPRVAAFQNTLGGGYDAFLSKLNAAGTTLTYSTYLGGTGFDHGTQLALDTSSSGCTGGGARCVVLVGKTASSGLSTAGVTQTTFGGGDSDAFVAKFNNAGSRTLFTYLGGSLRDFGTGVAVDTSVASGAVFVSGLTRSSNFPTTAGVLSTSLQGTQDAFVVKLNSTFTTKTYSTYMGGSGIENNAGIGIHTVAAVTSAYVVGDTTSANFPTANALDTSLGGTKDLYIAKLNTGATALTYSTYLGGTGVEEALGYQNIAVDTNGLAWVTGKTTSTVAQGFPVVVPITSVSGLTNYPTGAISSSFISQVLQADSAAYLRFSGYLGGTNGSDIGVGIAVDTATSAVYVTGVAASSNFPATTGVLDITQNGGMDGFIAKITVPAIIAVQDTNATVNGGASVTVNVPAGTTGGDVMIACIANRDPTLSVATPVGWTQIATIAQSTAQSGRITAFFKVATPAEAATVFVLNPALPVPAVRIVGAIATFRNVANTSLLDTSGTSTTVLSATHAAPSVTTIGVEDLILTCIAENRSATFTPPAGPPAMTEIVDASVGSATTGISLELSYVLQSIPGASGAKTATASQTQSGEAITIAIKR